MHRRGMMLALVKRIFTDVKWSAGKADFVAMHFLKPLQCCFVD